MIVRNKKHILQMLFTWKGSVLKKIYPVLILLFAFSWGVFAFHYYFPEIIIPLNVSAFTLLGISLAIFLGFCNNAAYDRFWEGRKLWGSLVIHTRSLTYQILNYVEIDMVIDQEQKDQAIRMIAAFGYALKDQLRSEQDCQEVKRLLGDELYAEFAEKKYKPSFILHKLTEWVQVQYKMDRIDTITRARIDENINELSMILGGCERILHTRIPFPYFVLLDRTVYIYCFILPFGLIEMINWAMPFFVTFVAYSFIALDAIAVEIAEPFGKEENDLALYQICQGIEYSIFELAELPLPDISAPNEKFIIE